MCVTLQVLVDLHHSSPAAASSSGHLWHIRNNGLQGYIYHNGAPTKCNIAGVDYNPGK
jgi:hypothetical protein